MFNNRLLSKTLLLYFCIFLAPNTYVPTLQLLCFPTVNENFDLET